MDVLETPRLLLRRWDETCLEPFAALASDPVVMRYIGSGEVWTRERVLDKHRSLLRHWEQHGYGWRIVADRADGSVIGLMALQPLGPNVPGLDGSYTEIGWWFTPAVWGRGLAGEAALALRDNAFQQVGVTCLVGRYQPANVASGRIMDRLGMSFHSDYQEDASGRTVRVKTLHRADWERGRHA